MTAPQEGTSLAAALPSRSRSRRAEWAAGDPGLHPPGEAEPQGQPGLTNHTHRL